jgi:tetratricopeptide (TPR) repeat protein
VALSNLASALMAQGDLQAAERLFRESLSIYGETLAPDHLNAAIGHIKLGRALLRQGRFREAAIESNAGYHALVKQADPAVSFLRAARLDLATAYDSLDQPGLAARFRAELADTARRGN